MTSRLAIRGQWIRTDAQNFLKNIDDRPGQEIYNFLADRRNINRLYSGERLPLAVSPSALPYNPPAREWRIINHLPRAGFLLEFCKQGESTWSGGIRGQGDQIGQVTTHPNTW